MWAGNSLLMALRMSFALGIRPKRGHFKRLPPEKAPFPTDSGSATRSFSVSFGCSRNCPVKKILILQLLCWLRFVVQNSPAEVSLGSIMAGPDSSHNRVFIDS